LSPGLSSNDGGPLFAGASVRAFAGGRQRSGLNKTHLSRGRPTKIATQAPARPRGRIKYQISNIKYQISNIKYQISNIKYQMKDAAS
jgi:hypothetical protein